MSLPLIIKSEGYTLEELQRSFSNAQNMQPVLALQKRPSVEFYKEIHAFLGRWEYTRNASKTAIGRFYIAIDPYLRQRDFRPINAYRFVSQQKTEREGFSTEPLMPAVKLQEDAEQDSELQISNTSAIYEEPTGKEDLPKTMEAIEALKCKYERKIGSLQRRAEIREEEIHALQNELEMILQTSVADESLTEDNDYELPNTDFHQQEKERCDSQYSLHTKSGKSYSTSTRKLYYNLLVAGMPPGNISPTIKIILQQFLPDTDISAIKLPKQSCAQYMRRDELKTINDVHKAITLTKDSGPFHLNSDGTTLKQHKIATATINNLVLSVHELPSGAAEQIAKGISMELEHLRKIARLLNLPNADCINWGLVASSTSDSAATQKKFNEIVQKLKEEDTQKFGHFPAESGPKLVSNFCAMHLGVNLRKAFLQGSDSSMQLSEATAVTRPYPETDTIVHEFCKVFGTKGTPEYSIGVTSFPDFLEIGVETVPDQQSEYYRSCLTVTLERQVGSRYFVTASNAAKLFYLRDAACDYLKHFRKNKLEKDVYEKLHDENIMAGVKVDGLMFVHVYADLVTLAKSKELGKSAFDMNLHYLELDGFLEQLESDSSVALDPHTQVFTTEKRLYDNTPYNHRQQSANIKVYKRLFRPDPSWDKLLVQKLCKGAVTMRCKLHTYAKDYLPTGKYWDPPDDIKQVLQGIAPSNDICESILGLNDYLQSALTNASQRTKSNLIEAKKNKTIAWLNAQPTENQQNFIEMATKQRQTVAMESKRQMASVKAQRQQVMKETMEKQIEKDLKLQQIRNELTGAFLVISKTHLQSALTEIENDRHMSTLQKTEKQRELIKTQYKIRKTILEQNGIRMCFTRGGKNVPLQQLITEFEKIVDSNPIDPLPPNFSTDIIPQLVGKEISHRFYDKKKKEYTWYTGLVLHYDDKSGHYEVAYTGEEEHSFFNLRIDYAIGDLKILK